MSRSCPRVMSPSPARSTLITSAPNQARSCVQVGPDCTCVKSRMRTPSSALPIAFPYAFRRAIRRAGHAFFLAVGLRLVMRPLSVPPPSSMTALISVGRLLRIASSIALRSSSGVVTCDAHAAERLHQLLVARVLDEHQRRGIGAARRVLLVAAVHAVVVHDDDAHRQVVAADRLGLHAGEAERAVALDRDHLLPGDRRPRRRSSPCRCP